MQIFMVSYIYVKHECQNSWQVHCKTAVTAYLKSKQLLLFVFAVIDKQK